MILRIKKTNSKKVVLKTVYTKNSILLNSKEVLLLSKEGDIEIDKNYNDRRKRENSFLNIAYEYHKPYLQIAYDEGKLLVRSLYFLEASTSGFYSSKEDKKEGLEEEISLSFEELKDKLNYHGGLDSFYIINKEAKPLVAFTLEDGVIQYNFDIKRAIQSRDSEDYDYIMVSSCLKNIDAKYFSIRQNASSLILKTKEIPIHSISIYDVVKEASTKRIEDSEVVDFKDWNLSSKKKSQIASNPIKVKQNNRK